MSVKWAAGGLVHWAIPGVPQGDRVPLLATGKRERTRGKHRHLLVVRVAADVRCWEPRCQLHVGPRAEMVRHL